MSEMVLLAAVMDEPAPIPKKRRNTIASDSVTAVGQNAVKTDVGRAQPNTVKSRKGTWNANWRSFSSKGCKSVKNGSSMLK